MIWVMMTPDRNALMTTAVIRNGEMAWKRETSVVRARVDRQSSMERTAKEGRAKRCLYLLANCEVDDPYS